MITYRFVGGPWAGRTQQFPEADAPRSITVPVEIDGTLRTVEYRWDRRLEVDNGDGLGPNMVLVEMKPVTPGEVRKVENELNTLRRAYGLPTVGFRGI